MPSFNTVAIGAHNPDLHKNLRVAVGHIPVDKNDIEASFMGAPNISRTRKSALSELLNDVVAHGVRCPAKRTDLLVLPEVSIPHSWATFITRWAKSHQIGIVCGLEHRLDNQGCAWNELLAVLPFRNQNGTKECIPVRRLKRHYSPHETFLLTNNN
ncbi:MAG: hypothetical protein R3B84_01705 [Zavarzinella sp.]